MAALPRLVESAHIERVVLLPAVFGFSYGLEHLCQMRRDDLTMEALILSLLSLGYRDQLFSPRKLPTAQERLDAARQLYPPPPDRPAFS